MDGIRLTITMTDVPKRELNWDTYSSFADLARERREGVDYAIRLEDRHSTVAIIAPHGGSIEPGTCQIAAAIAADDWSLYCFEGLLPSRPHGELHITSALFDEPRGCELVAQADIVLAVHGRADNGNADTVHVGGLDQLLRNALLDELSWAGFKAALGTGHLAGMDPSNICNRGRYGAGVQLEIPRTLRNHFCEASDALGGFTGAVRAAVLARLQSLD